MASITASAKDALTHVLLVAVIGLLAILISLVLEARKTARLAEAREAQLRQELQGLTEEVRYEISPTQRARIEGSILAVLRDGKPVGVAFFVSPTRRSRLRTTSKFKQRPNTSRPSRASARRAASASFLLSQCLTQSWTSRCCGFPEASAPRRSF
jgi:hypothetical protein